MRCLQDSSKMVTSKSDSCSVFAVLFTGHWYRRHKRIRGSHCHLLRRERVPCSQATHSKQQHLCPAVSTNAWDVRAGPKEGKLRAVGERGQREHSVSDHVQAVAPLTPSPFFHRFHVSSRVAFYRKISRCGGAMATFEHQHSVSQRAHATFAH